LLLLVPLISTVWLPVLIGLLAITYLASVFVIRRQYSQALVKMLEQEDYSFLLSQEASTLTAADPATLNQLRKKLEASSNYEFTIFIAQLISQIGGSEAVPILGQAARAAKEGRIRAAIIDVLVAAELSGESLRQLYSDFLNDANSQVRQSALAGLEQLVGPDDEQFLTPALTMLKDPEVEVRTQTLSALARGHNFYTLPPAVQALDQLLAQKDTHQRVCGVLVLGQIADMRTMRSLTNVTRSVYRLTTYLTDPEDEVRLRAALAVETVSKNKLTEQLGELILQRMSSLVNDPVERIRQATLVVYSRLGQQESHTILLKALADTSPQVRTAAVELLIQQGKSVIPLIHRQLDSPDPQLRKMATVILGRINRREFGGLVNTHLTGNLLTIYHNHGLIKALSPGVQYSSIATLQSVLREQNQQLIDEIFYLLTAIHDKEDVEIVAESLQSESPRIRANATEALESLTTPQTAKLIAPLFKPGLAPARLLRLSKNTWDMKHPKTAEAIKELVSDPDAPWLRAIMTFALGEIGVSLSPGKTELDTNKLKGRKTRRSQPIDPLAVLANTSEQDKPKKKPKRGRSRPLDLLATLADVAQEPTPRSRQKTKTSDRSTPSNQIALTLPEIKELLEISLADPIEDVRLAAQAANRMLAGFRITEAAKEEKIVLSTIEKIIFLKEVPFFQGMTINQLEVLANICEEKLFEEEEWIFHQNDPGGALYVIVSGRVGIEQEKRKGASYARLSTLGPYSYFGEITLFDNSPRSASAIALQDTFTLRLRREPLIVLARQYPDVSLELIQTLSKRLRQANKRIAELTRTRPRELQKIFDKLD
jgi:CRP-like cAMP-binding protein/HEAT repeat protein